MDGTTSSETQGVDKFPNTNLLAGPLLSRSLVVNGLRFNKVMPGTAKVRQPADLVRLQHLSEGDSRSISIFWTNR
jgi:hypothetical protein